MLAFSAASILAGSSARMAGWERRGFVSRRTGDDGERGGTVEGWGSWRPFGDGNGKGNGGVSSIFPPNPLQAVEPSGPCSP